MIARMMLPVVVVAFWLSRLLLFFLLLLMLLQTLLLMLLLSSCCCVVDIGAVLVPVLRVVGGLGSVGSCAGGAEHGGYAEKTETMLFRPKGAC